MPRIRRLRTRPAPCPSRRHRRAGRALFLAALLALGADAATARTLHWRSIAVEAHLDADGRLRVVERQTMVFDGDWNGGERTFRLPLGQEIDLHRIVRLDPATGEERQLVRGDLDAVDRFDWHDRETLRWRSRLPSDPVFESTEITYQLEYTLSRILRQEGDVYRFDHDFGVLDRPGNVERFTVDLTLDPAWRPTSALPEHFAAQSLAPGVGMPVSVDLAHAGGSRPAAVVTEIPLAVKLAAFVAALVAMAALTLRFRRHEASRGRYEAVEVPRPLDREWLAEHLFDLPPEEVGALWDRKVGPPEVAATLARLVAEGKLASSVKEKGRWWRKQILTLTLEAERGAFLNHERKLVDKLFFGGRTETDTDAVRQHYRGSGFDPVGLLRGPIERRLRQRLGSKPAAPSYRLPWLLLLGFAGLMALEGVIRGAGALVVLGIVLLATPVPFIIGSLFVAPYGRWTRRLVPASMGFVAPALLLALFCWGGVLAELLGVRIQDLSPGVFGVLALAIFPVTLLAFWLHAAATREPPKMVRKRHLLAAVRRAFAAELEGASPALDDAWFPYLLAFGLDRQVDRWFGSFGGARRGSSSGSAIGSSSSPGSLSSTSSWTGGGGSFGGAGATAGWAGAAAGLAAGVARPSSGSSSGGGSSGGGSSSGGGGGGGW